MASDDLRARIARIRSDAERSVHPDWRDINPTWVLLNELDRLTALNDELRGKVTALEASYEAVAADAMAHGLCSLKRHSLLQRAEKAEAERDHLASACRTMRRRLTVLGAALPPGLELYVGKIKAMRVFLADAVADIPASPTEEARDVAL